MRYALILLVAVTATVMTVTALRKHISEPERIIACVCLTTLACVTTVAAATSREHDRR